jgi:hypothetical protein
MKIQSTIIFSVLFILSISSFNYSGRISVQISSKRIETRSFVKSFGAQLKERDMEKLRPYFSEDCFAEFLKMSDSLRNDYPSRISKAIQKRQFTIEKKSDSTSVLSLGKRDVVLGRTVGFFFINTTPGAHKIYVIRAPK